MGPSKPSMQELYASPEDWELHRQTITRLYLHEKRPLQEVMEHMAVNHMFFATVKMYRSRIRKWGIDKNNKAAEVAYMVRLKKQRDMLGKKSCFFIRDRPVDWEDIERYLARTPDFWAKDRTRDSRELSRCAREVRCETPPPGTSSGSNPGSRPGSPPAAAPASVPQKLDAAQDLHIHEEILRFFRDYLDGAFQQGVWTLSPTHGRYFGPGGAGANARFNLWYDKVRNASDWPGRDADAVRLVNYLLDDLPQFIRDQDFTVFPALMRCCFYLTARRPALGRAVVRFVARLCRVILGERHPMSLAWARITSLEHSDYLLVLQGTAKVRLDHLESRHRLQQYDGGGVVEDENTINALREYLLVLRLRGPAAAEEMNRVAARAIEQASSRPDAGSPPSAAHCRLLLGTASSYITCRRLAEAEAVLDRVGAHLPASAMQQPHGLRRILPTYLFLAGFLRYVTGRLDEAVNYFLQTYHALEKARGAQSSAVADILLALIDLPGLLQKPQDVEYWQGKFAEVQAAMLARASKASKGARQTDAELCELWDEPLDTDVNTGMW